jgi:hypothetical protein
VSMVLHNGDEGGRFGRGSVGVVAGSGKGGGCSGGWPRSRSGVGRRRVHTLGGGSGGQPGEVDGQAGPTCQSGVERGEGGTR